MPYATYAGSRVDALGDGDERIRIAVLDGPVDLSHPCFAGAALREIAGTVPADGCGERALAHGTHVASIIFGQPGTPVTGLAPRCSGLILPIFRAAANGGLACSQLDLARAILTAAENGAHVINVSGGQMARASDIEPVLAGAIETCLRRDILIVAAAGNDGCDCLHMPAAAPGVLAVGAMDGEGRPLDASNWGEAYRRQGILAPGVDRLGAAVGGGTTLKTGTSFAAPFVSAAVGLLLSRQLARDRRPSPHAVRAAILATAQACTLAGPDGEARCLAGRIDLASAVTQLTEGEVDVSDSVLLHAAEGPFAPSVADGGPRPAPAPASTMRHESAEGPAHARVVASDLPAGLANAPGDITASDCGCGCGGKKEAGSCSCGGKCGGSGATKPAIVYALGRIGYDFGTEARRDSFAQAMGDDGPPENPFQLLKHLAAHPYEAPALIWTLNLDATPIYAVQPAGPYSEIGYERLREFLQAQIGDAGAELVSVPGVVGGSVRLQSGQVVPVIVPAIRGMYSWASRPLVASLLGAPPKAAADLAAYDQQSAGLADFLNRIYYDLRNLGITGEERALNYAATNAFQVSEVIASATRGELDLDTLVVKKSPVCRTDSDCYDVELAFYDPENTNRANRIFRFTIDVSDVIPVTIGQVRSWTRRG